jgi:hypothetical protein
MELCKDCGLSSPCGANACRFAAAIPPIRTFINVGTGYVLDGVGALSAFNIKREAGETDDSYRKRLLVKLDQLELPI